VSTFDPTSHGLRPGTACTEGPIRMQCFLVCDHPLIGGKVRQVLIREGLDCPAANLVRLDFATQRLVPARPDLIVVVLPPDAERALGVLTGLRGVSQAHIMVVGPVSDLKLVLRVLRGGTGDYVDEAELETELPAALKRWRARGAVPGTVGRTIAVLAASGGSGSSTLAVNVAVVLASRHRTAALLDLKLEQGDLAALLDLKPTSTLAEVCQNVARMDRVLFERSLVRHSSGVHLLAPPRLAADLGHVSTEGVERALTLARAAFPYVVVDLHPLFPEVQAPILPQAEVLLLVLRLEICSLRNVRLCLDRLGRMGVETDRIRLVANRHGQPGEVPTARAEESLGRKLAHFLPDDPRRINRASNNGVPVVLQCPSAKVSRSIAALTTGLEGRSSAP
jgi:pilus assembly protein CpaE